MALIYITGTPGSGKSAVKNQLLKLGYEAHDVDDKGIGGAYTNATHEIVDVPTVAERTPEWFSDHSWLLVPEAITALCKKSSGYNIFLCGTAANDSALWYLFDQVFFLNIDEDVLRTRIATRANDENDFGQSDHELDLILRRFESDKHKAHKEKVTVVDANQSVDAVVNDICKNLFTNTSNFYLP